MYFKKTFALIAFLCPVFSAFAFFPNPGDSIEEDYVNWYNLCPEEDKILGAAVDRAYLELLADKPSQKTIVVAVIDAGVDVEHEDLKGKIWVNKDEIPDNGVDDDSNGYVDDIHGWNFLGNENGENIQYANMELVRFMRDHDSVFENYSSESEVPDSLREDYAIYQTCLAEFEKRYEPAKEQWDQAIEFRSFFFEQEAVLLKELSREEGQVFREDLKNINPENEQVEQARNFFRYIYSNGFTYRELNQQWDYHNTTITKHLNLEFDPRPIIGDDITDMSLPHGNNQVKGPSSEHGTLVAGVIAAERNNEIGVNGIADDVEIMALRTVPDGDEYDKDVAMSIIYAVDNGADIINMSFGKYYSPQKNLVDEALQYAAQHNVLLVHAAGNDATNSDESTTYPTDFYGEKDTLAAWLGVGANNQKKGKRMPAVFSNYGKNTVDLFAPGMNIVSTFPENRYDVTNGTSFAGPVVSGVAALIWSRYPELTAMELKDVLLQSTYKKYYKKKVYRPFESKGDREKVRFYELSATGGFVNAYYALLLAEEAMEETKTLK